MEAGQWRDCIVQVVNSMPSMMHVLRNVRAAIVGCGIMGASVGLCLRSKGAGRLLAIDPCARSLETVQAQGWADERHSRLRNLEDVNVVFLCAPVCAIVDTLRELAGTAVSSQTLLLDVGSTKRAICASMSKLSAPLHAVGGHPICGSHLDGPEHADVHMFQGKTFTLTKTGSSNSWAEEMAHRVVREGLDAQPLWITAGEHDGAMARLSHSPWAGHESGALHGNGHCRRR